MNTKNRTKTTKVVESISLEKKGSYSLNYVTYSFRFAEEVLNGKIGTKREVEDIIRSINLPVSEMGRKRLNQEFVREFVARGWKAQHQLFPMDKGPRLAIDFLKNRVGVEVAFSHASFIGIDMLKFQTLSYSNLDKIDVGIHIVATKNFFPKKWKGSQNFERVKEYLPIFRSAIQVPVWVVGLLPTPTL